MTKQRSTHELWPSDYFFAVYPVSLTFQRAYRTPFHLYFERGLQLISKHETPLNEVSAQQTVKFQNPQQIHYFRIQSEKNLDYQWSLYIFRVDMEGDNEQFIEGQKISLNNQWNNFKTSKNSLFQDNVTFKTIRCQLSYIIVIGTSIDEVSQQFQNYFGSKKVPAIIAAEKSNDSRKEQQQGTKVQLRTGQGFLDKVQINKRGLYSNQMQLHLGAQQKANRPDQLLSPRGENPKLSNSQLDIGKEIEERVITKQNSIKQNFTPKYSKNVLQVQEKNIRMTNSQLLNQKKQALAPLNQQKNLIWVFVCLIILIIGSGVWFLSKNSPQGPQAAKGKKGKRTKQANKQTSNKKKKGKK